MKAALVLVVIGSLALVVEGALVTVLPPLLLPDVALVGSIAAALFLTGAPALGVLAGLGFASDLLSGAPLGLHVVALLIPFVVTRLANGSLEIRRGMSEAVLVALLTPWRESSRRAVCAWPACTRGSVSLSGWGWHCRPP